MGETKDIPGDSPILDRCRFVRGLDLVPALPANVFHLMAKLHQTDVSPGEVERLVSGDPGLVTHLLRIVNSPFFGLSEPVLNIQRAVTVIGLDNLRQVLSAHAARLVHDGVAQPRLQQALWHHAISVGVTARLLTEAKYRVARAEAYVMGLLHDIGKVAIVLHDPGAYAPIAGDPGRDAGQATGLELERFGFTHLEAGWMLLEQMGFAPALKEVAAFHHDPEYAPGGAEMVWVVSLANRLAHRLAEDDPLPGIGPHLSRLGLTPEQLHAVRIVARAETQRFPSFF